MLNHQQKTLIDKISRENGFKTFSISVESDSKKGDNYLGNISRINIKENDNKKQACYILKCAETDLSVRSQLPMDAIYQREIFVYETILPAFESFQKKYRVKHPFRAHARMLGSCAEAGNEFLLLEDIRWLGFSMLDRRMTMDDEHVALVFRELAKFHSISLAMKSLEPETYKRLTENLDNYFAKNEGTRQAFQGKFAEKIEAALKLVEGHQNATAALRKCLNEFRLLFDELRDERYHLVITHGDPWCNNIMFKYDDKTNETKPTSICFLDWQISKIQTPVSDLFYFLFPSASKNILDNHTRYLDLYHQVIDENLRSVGCDTESVFPYELFKEHLKRFFKISFIMALGTMDVFLREETDARSYAELAEGGSNIVDQLWSGEKGSDEYCRRVKDIVFMALDNGYL